MKIRIICSIIVLALLFAGCSHKQNYKGRDLVLKDGLLYRGNEKKPFSGKVADTVSGKLLEYNVLNGKKNGEFSLKYMTGILAMKGRIIDNRNQGLWNYYYPDGKLESSGYFRDDLPDSTWTWFFQNGNMKETGKFSLGKREGKWLSYNNDGRLFVTRIFKNGILKDSVLAR